MRSPIIKPRWSYADYLKKYRPHTLTPEQRQQIKDRLKREIAERMKILREYKL